jgi:hypothetical protein
MPASRFARRAAPLAVLLLGLAAVAGAAPTRAEAQARRDSLTLYELPDYRGASVTFYGDNANIGSTGFSGRAQSAQVIGSWRLCAGGGYRNRCETLSGNIRDLGQYGLSRQVGSAQRLSGDAYAAAPPPRFVEPPVAAPYEPAPTARYAPPTAYPLPPAQARSAQPYAPPPATTPYGGAYLDSPYTAPAAPPYQPGYSDARPGYGGADPYYDYVPPVAEAPYDAADTGAIDGQNTVFFPRPILNGMDVSAARPGAAEAFCREAGLGQAVYFDQSQRAARSLAPDRRAAGPGPILRDVLCRR